MIREIIFSWKIFIKTQMFIIKRLIFAKCISFQKVVLCMLEKCSYFFMVQVSHWKSEYSSKFADFHPGNNCHPGGNISFPSKFFQAASQWISAHSVPRQPRVLFLHFLKLPEKECHTAGTLWLFSQSTRWFSDSPMMFAPQFTLLPWSAIPLHEYVSCLSMHLLNIELFPVQENCK